MSYPSSLQHDVESCQWCLVSFLVAAPDFFRAAKDVIPTLRGIKHTTPSITNMTDMLAEFGDRYQVLCGLDEVQKC